MILILQTADIDSSVKIQAFLKAKKRASHMLFLSAVI